mgnify:CR=1 FL=1
MTEFLGNMYSWFTFIPKITLSNLFEILILTVLIYEVLLWVKSTRAGVLLRGGMIIVGFYLLAAMFHLNTITWIINHMGQLVLTALIIIFQPELRKALEQLGSKNIITDLFISENSRLQEGYTEKTVNEITRAAFEMGKVKTGALIVIERDTPLPEIERTGIPVDGIVTSQLLINIFEHNTPLHDGAVVIRGNRVTAATCYLPLSDNMDISKALGTRHRAAVGVSEATDSVTLVVSEETGRVSVAVSGRLKSVKDGDELRDMLSVLVKRETENTGRFRIWKGRRRNERKADE